MNKCNFDINEIGLLVKNVANFGTVRINKCGNLEVKLKNTSNEEKYVLYLTQNNKYIWRRFSGLYKKYNWCCPLNMKRNKPIKFGYDCYLYRPYKISNSEFNTALSAILWFDVYLNKNPKSPSGKYRTKI